MNTDRLISLSGVKKVFHTNEVETHALSNITLDINKGEYVAITGPSGCGKSTLLSVIGLLDTLTEGQFMFAGRDATTLSRKERADIRNRQIGFIFQSFHLISDLTVEENVELPLTYRDDIRSSQRQSLVQAALEKVDMIYRSRHYPSQLSGGQQQRVAVARAIAGGPLVVLADEPTGNLDTRNAEEVMDLLDELHAGGATICMVTHDPRSAQRAERGIELLDGQIIADHGFSHKHKSKPVQQVQP
jgi:putative ABC transport system ATP-binding protein